MQAPDQRVAAQSAGGDAHPARWRMLGILTVAELLGMMLWFAASAVSAQYTARWSLTASQAAWLTTVVQLGFVAGTATSALLSVPDIVPARSLFAVSALLGAAANAMLLQSEHLSGALVWRFVTGLALAGVYPPAMKMIATWFRVQRGLAVGTIVGALTVGKALPYLVHAIPGAGITPVVSSASVGACVAALLVWFGYREGPYPFPARPLSWSLVRDMVQTPVWRSRVVHDVVTTPAWRLSTAGYLGHMFELYAAWTWLPVFIAASIAVSHPTAGARGTSVASAIAFAALAIGGIGCIWGGFVADRRGRPWLVTRALAMSGTCSVLIGFAFGRSLWLLVPIALVWGFFVIADSAQFSVLVTESVPPHAVGTALTLQTSLGFLLTAVVIQLVPPLAELVGWRWAFAGLSLGPLFGIAAIRRLVRLTAGHR